MNKIEEGIAAVDTAITDVKNGYLPLSGGTIDGELSVGHDIDTTGDYCLIKNGSIVSATIDGNAKIEALNNNDGSNIKIFPAKIVFYGEGDTLQSTFTGVSDSKGTSSTLAVSQKCLSDNYIAKTSAAVSAAINLLPAGTSAPVDGDYYVCQSVGGGTTDTTYYRRPTSYLWSYINGKLENNYLPLSGGTITGDTTIMGSGGQYGLRIINGDIHFLSDGGSSVLGVLGGIVSSKGTSTAHAMSQKGVADNYFPLSGGVIGTEDSGNYSSIKPGEILVSTIGDAKIQVIDFRYATNITILPNEIKFYKEVGSELELHSTLSGVSDLKGTSSTIVPSQKCLNDNYVAKSDLPSNLLKYQIINSTSDIGTDANTAYLILE